jgi:hypothetical protein
MASCCEEQWDERAGRYSMGGAWSDREALDVR